MVELIKTAIINDVIKRLVELPNAPHISLVGSSARSVAKLPGKFYAYDEVSPRAISVDVQGVDVEYTYVARTKRKMRLMISSVLLGARGGESFRNLSEAAAETAAAVAFALLRDPQRGGLAESTRLVREFEDDAGGEGLVSEQASTTAGFEYEITYRHPYDDPYVPTVT